MSFKKYVLPIIAFLGIASSQAFAQEHPRQQDSNRFDEELNERDFEALKEYLKSKRIEEVNKKGLNEIVFTGEVRFEWRHLDETQNGRNLRGGHAVGFNCLPISRNDFDVELNLRIDYVTERTWAVALLQYDNSAGVDDNEKACILDPAGYHGSGECDTICLKKAFFGYNVFDDGCSRFDIEIGRSNLFHAFDSRVQFLSRFDGILFTFTSKWENISNWYLMLAGFVVDERVNQFAYATEIGLRDILDSGVDFRYSLIDWRKRGFNRCLHDNPVGFKFLNSQFSLSYSFNPEIICTKARVYGAYLINHLGRNRRYRRCRGCEPPRFAECREGLDEDRHCHEEKHKTAKHQNTAWYVGCIFGEVKQEGDWSFEVQYQYVQAFAMPDNDMSGIGRGNVLKESVTGPCSRGNTNFKGWRFEALYAITDELTLDSIIEFSQQVDSRIGGRHHYSKFELETIYAF
jgi:hypothetical protein